MSTVAMMTCLLYSEVWKGEYKGKKVAIKSMKEIKSPQATQQFLAEASIMTYVKLSHFHLIMLSLL